METIRQCLRRWKPVTELVLTVAVIAVAIFAAYVAWRSDATFKEEAELLREAKTLVEQEDSTFKQEAELLRGVKTVVEQENAKVKQGVEVLDKASELLKQSTTQSAQQVAVLSTAVEVLNQSEMLRAREAFNKALDDADAFCSGCPACSPIYYIEVPLDRAVQSEIKAEKLLGAAEYNRLATLGLLVWEVSKTEAFAKKALARSGSSLDHFFSHLVLGHVYFSHLEKGAELTKIEAARNEFKLAMTSLQTETTTDATRTRIGECCAIWAAHEGYLGNNSMYSQVVGYANSVWSKLPNEAQLKSNWYATIGQAIHGNRPQISCLFKPPAATVPITLMPPVPSISVSPATAASPEPTPAPTIPVQPPTTPPIIPPLP